MSYTRVTVLSAVLFACGVVQASTKVDIAFKGKTDLHYTDVCTDKGTAYKDYVFNYGQFECSPKFSEYGGVPLIKELKDYCDSKVQYDPVTGKVIDLKISYGEFNFNQLLNVLTERYGKGVDISSNAFTDPKLNIYYEWKDARGGRILLHTSSVSYVPEGKIFPVVSRYCTVLSIETKEMNALRDAMEKKSEAINKNRIRSNASKL